MTNWTEAQIDRHLHLWEHRHGPDSPEAGIVRQLRAERDAAREAFLPTAANLAGAASAYRRFARRHPSKGKADVDALFSMRADDFDKAVDYARAALPTTQETPHE